MPFIRLTKLEKRRILTLVLCLVLATLAWLFLALNNKYVYIAKTVLIYNNFPQKRAFHPLQSDTVDLQVEGTGWQLLFARLRIKPQSIVLSLSQLNNKNFIVSSEQLRSINSQLETSQKVISLIPDTLYFDFSKRTVKQIPIKLVKNIGFQNQYGISDDIKLTPKFVTISGPIEELNKIESWPTDTLKVNNVNADVSKRISMQHSQLKNINIFPSSAQVNIPIDEFTEKTIEVPLKIMNNLNYYNLKLYPKKVKVTFIVALSNYEQINADFIEASVDVMDWQKFNHHQLDVKLTRFPNYCKLVKISPSKIDFIIEK